MRRQDWRDRDEARHRRSPRHEREDYGQADYSDRYRYDPETRSGYRTYEDGRRSAGAERPYFSDRPQYGGGPFAYVRRMEDEEREPRRRDPRDHRDRRDGPSDRVLWAVIMERLEDQRGLDLRDVRVDVYGGEVTLDGTVKHKADKRRIEDVADIEGVRNVQNNLRVRERNRRWTFL